MIIRLSHVEVGVTDLDHVHAFYVGILGFQVHDWTNEALFVRASHEFDRWSLKLSCASGPGLISVGFRVSEPEDLARLAEIHERLGLRHAVLPAGFHEGRGEGLRVATPSGHVLDFHHEIEEVDVHGLDGRVVPPTRQPLGYTGVPPTELDHVNLRVLDFEAMTAYLEDDLDFSISEYAVDEDGRRVAAWMRRTRTTHEVAVLGHERVGIHHFAYLVADGAALLRTCDLLADAGYAHRIQGGPGRHGATDALAMYFLDPDGNRIEFYSGDYHRDLDRPPIRWSHDDFLARGRFRWGAKTADGFHLPTPLLDAGWPTPVVSTLETDG